MKERLYLMGIRVPLKTAPEFTTPKCVVLLYCVPRKTSIERNGEWKLSFETLRIYRGLSTETITRILWANQRNVDINKVASLTLM